jgi:hypothetical protein
MFEEKHASHFKNVNNIVNIVKALLTGENILNSLLCFYPIKKKLTVILTKLR